MDYTNLNALSKTFKDASSFHISMRLPVDYSGNAAFVTMFNINTTRVNLFIIIDASSITWLSAKNSQEESEQWSWYSPIMLQLELSHTKQWCAVGTELGLKMAI